MEEQHQNPRAAIPAEDERHEGKFRHDCQQSEGDSERNKVGQWKVEA